MIKELTNKKFGLLTVIGSLGTDKHQKMLWSCQCKCGNKHQTTTGDLTSGKVKSCGCLRHRPYNFRGYKDIGIRYWKDIQTKCSRGKRQIFFELTIEQAWNLFVKQKKKCALTGLDLNFGKNRTASLDRIDSNIGYVIDNVQWVHKDINRMKNSFQQQHFISMCKLVAKHE